MTGAASDFTVRKLITNIFPTDNEVTRDLLRYYYSRHAAARRDNERHLIASIIKMGYFPFKATHRDSERKEVRLHHISGNAPELRIRYHDIKTRQYLPLPRMVDQSYIGLGYDKSVTGRLSIGLSQIDEIDFHNGFFYYNGYGEAFLSLEANPEADRAAIAAAEKLALAFKYNISTSDPANMLIFDIEPHRQAMLRRNSDKGWEVVGLEVDDNKPPQARWGLTAEEFLVYKLNLTGANFGIFKGTRPGAVGPSLPQRTPAGV